MLILDVLEEYLRRLCYPGRGMSGSMYVIYYEPSTLRSIELLQKHLNFLATTFLDENTRIKYS
jgi:hypothetical protein